VSAFTLALPGRIHFGSGEARARAAATLAALGPRGVLVHGATGARAGWLIDDLAARGIAPLPLPCPGEPTLPMLEAALALARDHRPAWIAAVGGGAALDLGKALAALAPGTGPVIRHLETAGPGAPLEAAPLPFVALPTTAGTGAEATRNAVIGLVGDGRKVSLRDERMLPRVAIVDPDLTLGCPWPVTLASGLDALTQLIEPYVSARANPFTDALALPAIPRAIAALRALEAQEDPSARGAMAWASLSGGIALANAGLGAVHGFAGVIGGLTGAAHGAICGALLGPVLEANRAALPSGSAGGVRIAQVCAIIADAFGCDAAEAPATLARWARGAGLPGLAAQGLDPADHGRVAQAALGASSMKANPVVLPPCTLEAILEAAA